MTLWNGSQWVQDRPAVPSRPRPGRRFIGAVAEATLITMLIFGLIATTALAAKGGNGQGKSLTTSATQCSVDGNGVTGSGLPIGVVLNFFVTDSSGTWGWVLGFTDTGEWAVPVPDRTGPTTYEFGGRTYGKDGTMYNVYASCSAS